MQKPSSRLLQPRATRQNHVYSTNKKPTASGSILASLNLPAATLAQGANMPTPPLTIIPDLVGRYRSFTSDWNIPRFFPCDHALIYLGRCEV
jgi:hypothetical protein